MKTKKRSMRAPITQLRARAAAGKPGDFAAQAKAMEEDVEFSNVTNFRNSLLGAVEQLQSNPAKRYVITKRGEPEAVLMSYKTYSLLTRVMNQTLEKLAARDRQDPVHAAFDRMRREHPLEAPALQMSAAALDSAPYPVEVVGTVATAAGEPHDISSLQEKIQAIRRQVVELDDTLKRQTQAELAPRVNLVSEKE